MEEALQHKETAQFIGLPTASLGSLRGDGHKAEHALTFKPDHSMGADQFRFPKWIALNDGRGVACHLHDPAEVEKMTNSIKMYNNWSDS